MAAPKRVLLTLDTLAMDGVSFSAVNLAVGLRRKGVSVRVLAREEGVRIFEFREAGIPVDVAKWYGVPVLGHRVLAALRDFAPQVVHAQTPLVAAPSRRLARDLNCPLVITANRLDPEENAPLAEEDASQIVAVSDAIQEHLTNRIGIARNRIRVIPNGLDLSRFPKPSFDGEEKQHLPVVGTYGTLTTQKGQRVLVEAAAKVLGHDIDAEFLLLGQGPDKPELRKIAETLGIAHRITFTHSTTSDVHSMGNIDLFVEPTRQEGLGLSVMQAMAAGIPVIASGVGGLYSLVDDGETGVLVPSGNSDALAEAIEALLKDPVRRRELARSARERIEQDFSAEAVAAQMLDCYAARIGE